MAKSTPLQTVKEAHGSKEALVAKVAKVVEPLDGESADELKARLKHVANRKLLQLLAVGEEVKALGGREKLAQAIADLGGQGKDFPFVDRLKKESLGTLLELHRAAKRRSARANA